MLVRPQTFDPKKRITVEDALAHPYLEAYVSVVQYLDLLFDRLPRSLTFTARSGRRAGCTTSRSRVL